MKSLVTIFLAALIGSFPFDPLFAATSSEAPAAVLLGCRGDVTVVKRNGSPAAGTFGMPLDAGDEIRTGADSQAEIHFDNGQWVQIGPNSSTQVHGAKTASGTAASAGEKSFELVQNFLKLKDAEGTSSLARLRSGDKAVALRAASPVQTKIREGVPTFRWSATDPSTELRLTIYSDKGVHWKQDVSVGSSTLTYPGDAPALEPGVTYSWVLETTDPLVFPPLRSEAAFFEVLSQQETRGLEESLSGIERGAKPSDSTYHLFCASLYFSHGLMEEAISETTKALEVDPQNSELHAILARLYAETGRTQDALKEYDRLLERR
jgi:hypothetical protein